MLQNSSSEKLWHKKILRKSPPFNFEKNNQKFRAYSNELIAQAL